jgi:hypothetical protein
MCEIARHLSSYWMIAPLAFKKLGARANDFLHRLLLPVELDVARIQRRHIKHIDDKLVKDHRAVAYGARGLLLRRGQRGLGRNR